MQRGGAAARARFVEHLLREVPLAAPAWAPGQPFDTVYLGGGTPSLLAADELARVLSSCREGLPLAAEPWVFLEANPEDVTAAACAAWRALGVRTLSLGVQSFEAGALRFLGRRHSPEEARAAVDTARAAGFHTVSLDLIFGLPGQDAATWRRDLETAAALGAQHVSCYQLTIHERTVFGRQAERGLLAEAPEDAQARLFALTHEVLAAHGLAAYEVSNFAREREHRSRHNQKYWEHVPYLGLGPSAHSFDGARRWWNERRTARWEARVATGQRPVEEQESLDARALATEALLLRLRTTEGLDAAAFREGYGFDLVAANGKLIEELVADGRITFDGSRLVPTVAGLAVADGLAASFVLA